MISTERSVIMADYYLYYKDKQEKLMFNSDIGTGYYFEKKEVQARDYISSEKKLMADTRLYQWKLKMKLHDRAEKKEIDNFLEGIRPK